MPSFTSRLCSQLGICTDRGIGVGFGRDGLGPMPMEWGMYAIRFCRGHVLGAVIQPLFQRISKAEMEDLRAAHGGAHGGAHGAGAKVSGVAM